MRNYILFDNNKENNYQKSEFNLGNWIKFKKIKNKKRNLNIKKKNILF